MIEEWGYDDALEYRWYHEKQKEKKEKERLC